MGERITRRDMMKRSLLVLGATAGAGALLAGCGDDGEGGGGGDGLSCTDTSGLTEAEKQLRQQQQYTDHSTQEGKTCDNCQLYQPGQSGQCGGCQVVKGPIHPKGYCNLWVAKA